MTSRERKRIREKMLNTAIGSRCTICGKDIGYQMWEWSEKKGENFFVHRNCLVGGKKNE